MAVTIIGAGSDFSANPVAHKGLVTSETDGLVALHELRASYAKSANNAVSDQREGSVYGYPTMTDRWMDVALGKGIQLNHRPTNGSYSFMLVARNETGGATNGTQLLFASYPTAAASTGTLGTTTADQGSLQFLLFNYRWQATALVYDSTATPLTGIAAKSAFVDLPASSDFEMMCVTATEGTSLRVYHPRTGAGQTTSTTGKSFAYNAPFQWTTVPRADKTYRMSALGLWERAVSDAEWDTIYDEIKAQMAAWPTPLSI